MATIHHKDIVMFTKSEIARLQTWHKTYTREFNVIKHAQNLSDEKERLKSLIHDVNERIEELKCDLQVATGGYRL